jgi:hypothetical protein
MNNRRRMEVSSRFCDDVNYQPDAVAFVKAQEFDGFGHAKKTCLILRLFVALNWSAAILLLTYDWWSVRTSESLIKRTLSELRA